MKVYTIQAQAFAIKVSDQEKSDTPAHTHNIIHIWYGYIKFPLLKVHRLAELLKTDRVLSCRVDFIGTKFYMKGTLFDSTHYRLSL
jgi:hypothetical protein